ncbi:hypothetical protein AURANDRAFT_68068 [Aureococcus anophagefferens]|uniref:Uncharacterized protein n=1 Tax=Aureococcus anophagefferens TaxID=44056 RepID=F0YND9_AURAN|nr:hypothetical protein AURANDRAFT_68068 [Aureococcus anophagefferens]XP_009042060.1 hypothetical protein AURANDRAFT_68182 [Aureococcus anophagefferens]EGB03235.1 hypothetical protein AURANDRAFT_68182 [Aureococcus anophagefferens]EGB03356.1 hypothetical protein AURANDRAFT_68068 [Aureococcus anophagefferens]|eukprot:XP_009041929.1 hypothetical protein AURANDRAFT_68068 [Aureococcus anophagefferens]
MALDPSLRDRVDPEADLFDWEFDTHGDRECLAGNGGKSCRKYFVHGKYKVEEEESYYDDYTIPVEESIIWGTIVPTHSGRILSAFFQTHHLWTKEMLLFRGKPEFLGLNKAPFVLERLDRPLQLRILGLSMLETKIYIYNNMQNAQKDCAGDTCSELLCQMNQNRFEKGEGWPLGLMGGVLANKYERLAMPFCSLEENNVMHAGEEFTMLSFHGTVPGAPPPIPGKSRMHSVLYTKVGPLDPNGHIVPSFHFKQKELTIGMFHIPEFVSAAAANWINVVRTGFHFMV